MTAAGLSRRGFLVSSAVAGGFAIGFSSPLFGPLTRARGTTPAAGTVNTWIRIGADETITVLVGSSEMGQGVFTSLPQLVAEELHVDWAHVRSEAAPAAAAFVNPATGAQLTGGSMSVRGYYTALRTAGAAARDMLRAAAAARFGVAVDRCVAAHGVVTVPGTAHSASYGSLAAAAAALPVPAHPALTPRAQFRIIGTSVPRLDVPAKVRGAAVYGIDVRVPGMQHGVVVHCPSLVGTLVSAGPVPAGATAVVPLDNAVVVVAATTWDAMQAARALRPTWSIPASAQQLDSSVIAAEAGQLMTSGTAAVAELAGTPRRAIAAATRRLDLTYSVPYLPHANMEPLACTASVTAGGCEVWAPTQAPGFAAATAAAICSIPADRVTVHTTLLGGGLGRKFETDFVAQAVATAKAVGTPVKVTWPREEDFGHDQYRPMARIRIQAGLTSGRIAGWYDRIVSPSILFQRGWIASGDVDSQAVDGALELPYGLPNRLVEYVRHPAAVPVGFWRSVGNSINCFAVESAMDELARAARMDPIAFRLAHMDAHPRAAAVLRRVATLSRWSSAPPAGRSRGVAITSSFGSIVAQVAEVSQPAPGRIKVEKVWCVIDCGQVVNPSIVTAQMQGGIVQGLSASLWGGMSFDHGVASPRNFDDYRVARMRDMPVISVSIVPSAAAPGGVGEPGVPPIAPAVANAWARLTGVRKRALPLV